MRAWITKLRISNSLDAGEPLPDSVERRVDNSPELRRFERGLKEVDRALKEERPQVAPPAFLHGSIMHSVRAASAPEAGRRATAARLRAAVPAGLCLALLGWVLLRQHGADERVTTALHPLSAASSAVDLTSVVTQEIPSGVFTPLSEEMARLNLDAEDAARFLLASLP